MKNKIILLFGILTLIFLIITVGSHTFYHYRETVIMQKERAWLVAGTIARSLEIPMLAGEMERVQQMLVTVGEAEHLKRVHIITPKGIIQYSSTPARLGTLTGSALIFKVIREQRMMGDFEQRDGDNIYSLAMPIMNEPRCYTCHSSEQQLLGVLRVGLDWDPVRKKLAAVMRQDILVSVVYYLLIMVMAVLFQRLYNNAQQAVADLKQAQEQLIKTEKMAAIGQMAAAISHDLRNPLTGIKMATYYLATKINAQEPELSNILKDIELEIEYASNVVTNVLTYSRPMQLMYARCNLNELIESTMHFISLQNRDQQISVKKQYDPDMPSFLMDGRQMKQVVVNLLSNAIQAMPQGGIITLSTRRKQATVELAVQDSGSGVPRETRDNIFLPFFTTRARGVGLGLSIVDTIVKKHGGTVRAENVPGAGALFTVELPIRNDIPEAELTSVQRM